VGFGSEEGLSSLKIPLLIAVAIAIAIGFFDRRLRLVEEKDRLRWRLRQRLR